MRKYVTFNISVEGVELSSGAKADFYDVEVGVMADLDPGCPETGLSEGLEFDLDSILFELDDDHLRYCNEDDLPEGIQYTCDKVASHAAVELAIHKWLAASGQELVCKI